MATDTCALRLLVVGAHPDDCELQAGGLAALYRKHGHVVRFMYATNGNAGHFKLSGSELAATRREEARMSCQITGIEPYICDNNDGMLESGVKTRLEFIRAIREFSPDLIITHRTGDYHPDHRNTGILVQDCAYLLGVPNICPETPCMRTPPVIMLMYDAFSTPRPFKPDIAIDICDVFETKCKMAACHRSQFYEWLPWVDGELEKVPADEVQKFKWLTEEIKARDIRVTKSLPDSCNIKLAEVFQTGEYGRPLTDELKERFFGFLFGYAV